MERTSECSASTSTERVFHRSMIPCAGGAVLPQAFTRACESAEVHQDDAVSSETKVGVVAALSVVLLSLLVVAMRIRLRKTRKQLRFLKLRAAPQTSRQQHANVLQSSGPSAVVALSPLQHQHQDNEQQRTIVHATDPTNTVRV